MESRTESGPPTEATLAETVRELANQPTSDSRLGHARARAPAFAERVMLALYATGWAITAAAAINAELCGRRESAQGSEAHA